MGSNTPSHQLSSGLYVSGRPEDYQERHIVFKSTAIPYTGGDVKKSGELGKMFDIPVIETPKSLKPLSSPKSNFSTSGPISYTGFQRQNPGKSQSGPLSANSRRTTSLSGPLSRGYCDVSGRPSSGCNSQKNSGPLPVSSYPHNSSNLLPATGLITSGPITSGPINSPGSSRKIFSGPLDASGMPSKAANQAINNLTHHDSSVKTSFPMIILWVIVPLFIMGFVAGGFIFVTVGNAILLIAVGAVFMCLVLVFCWNLCWGRGSPATILGSYEDSDLRNVKDGEHVKVTGVVTCGSLPLESSFQRVNRCIYTSTGLYEYRGLCSKPARVGHHRFSWALRYSERRVVDFYISDFQSGLRALVKAGHGAMVMPLVHEDLVVNVSEKSKELPSDFVRWMEHKNLSRDDRMMRLKEGYIKEGTTVTVMGVVQRHENVLMIVPPRIPASMGCRWSKLMFPKTMDGLIISCEEVCKMDEIPL